MPFKAAQPEDFWKKVNKDGPIPEHRPDLGKCWLWTGSKQPGGYGIFHIGGRNRPAHRWAYEQMYAPIPKGIHACHKCDNPPCVNPDHVFPGDNKANMLDAVRKGRLWQNKRTHCKQGHPLSGHNLIIENRPHKGGISKTRLCRTCRNTWSREGCKRRRRGIYVSKQKYA